MEPWSELEFSRARQVSNRYKRSISRSYAFAYGRKFELCARGAAQAPHGSRELAPAPLYVLATGVTDGNLLKGVRYFSDGARTHSILMDLRTRTVRFVDTIHMFSRTPLREIRL